MTTIATEEPTTEEQTETEKIVEAAYARQDLRQARFDRERVEEITRNIRHLELLEISVSNGEKHLRLTEEILDQASAQSEHLETIADALDSMSKNYARASIKT